MGEKIDQQKNILSKLDFKMDLGTKTVATIFLTTPFLPAGWPAQIPRMWHE
jgi:hypothetical protein